MDKVLISNSQGESGIVNVVRYFTNNGSEYLIYSLNEVDESGYTRLYVTKLSGVDGVYSADTLNETEWNEIKNLVKTIVKANKEGLPVPVQDLNPKKINNIMLKDKKVFKLNAPLVNDLGSNKPNFGGGEDTGSQTVTNSFATPVQPTFDMPSAPAFEQPVQPAFDMPSAPTFDQSVQPAFDMPSAPTFEQPIQPSFDMPSAPAFEQPVQPSFDMPSMPSFEQPVQPSFDMPSTQTFEQPVQSAFDMPSMPSFEQPVQPAFDMPSTPTFDQPVQPAFDMPSTPTFDQPVQPAFDMPSAPTFEQPVQPAFDMPSAPTFEQPVQPTYNFGSDFTNPSSITGNTEDYQTLYNSELEKNKNMQNEVDRLNEELSKYKNMISSLKEIIEK